MTDKAFADLMTKRMALVEKLSALNSKQLLNTQKRSGIEVELQGCLEDIESDGETAANLAKRAELERRMAAAISACTDCERELDHLTEQLNILLQQTEPAP